MRTFYITKDCTGAKIHILIDDKEIASFYLTNLELDNLYNAIKDKL